MTRESCYTCPGDCGRCVGCGDGRCAADEDCASCNVDCGACSVCGNGRCEMDRFESCTNCPEDCGMCSVVTCSEALICTFGCFDLMGFPPRINLSCVVDCQARACADARSAIQNFFDCAITQIGTCTDIGCIMRACSAEIAACFRLRC